MEAAVIDPTSTGAVIEYLPGYDGTVYWGAVLWLLARLALALYLIASALAQFDRSALPLWDVLLRLGLAALVMIGDPMIHFIAIAAALGWLTLHFLASNNRHDNPDGGSGGNRGRHVDVNAEESNLTVAGSNRT